MDIITPNRLGATIGKILNHSSEKYFNLLSALKGNVFWEINIGFINIDINICGRIDFNLKHKTTVMRWPI